MKKLLVAISLFYLDGITAQNVGIGTNSPEMLLHIRNGNSDKVLIENSGVLKEDSTTSVYFKHGGQYTAAIKTIGQPGNFARLGLFTYTDAYTYLLKERLSILDNGAVGINNTNPQSALAVKSAGRQFEIDNPAIFNTGYSSDIYFKITGKYTSSIKSLAVGTTTARLGFFSGTTDNATTQVEKMSINDNGVGIGITAPQAYLHVKSATSFGSPHMIIEDANAEPAIIKMKNNVPNAEWRLEGYNTAFNNNSDFTIKYVLNGVQTRALQVRGNGRIGIGTSVIDAPLHIYANSSITTPQLLLEESQSEFARIKMRNSTGSYWDIAGMGAATNAGGLLNLYFFNGTTGADKFSLAGTGNLWIAGTLTQNSDERLKKNIIQLDGSMEKLEKIKGYHYNWKEADRDPGLQTGLLAQELEKVMPELVSSNPEGIKSVNYSGMIPYLLEAIKTLQHEIEELKQKK